MLICGAQPPGRLCLIKLDIGPLDLEPVLLKGLVLELFFRHPEAYLYPNSNPLQSSSCKHSLP
jgi:hypothetical protein